MTAPTPESAKRDEDANPARQLLQRAVVKLFGEVADKLHDYVLVTPPAFGKCLVVNWTSEKDARQDHTCRFAGGEHPCIEHPSLVYYRGAELLSPADLNARLRDPGASVSDRLLPRVAFNRVLSGFLETRKAPIEVHEFVLNMATQGKK
jgi:hypothetical protein